MKAEFLTAAAPTPFALIESLLWDGSFPLLAYHLDRVCASAEYFGFATDRRPIVLALEDHARTLAPGKRFKVRLLLHPSGEIAVSSEEITASSEPARVAIAAARIDSRDRFLLHKSTRRDFYDRALADVRARGLDDVLFLNERGEVTECAIHNLFAEIGGKLLTPPVDCGLLAGVYRRYLLENDARAEERVLTLADLRRADALYISNAVRGLRRAELVFLNGSP